MISLATAQRFVRRVQELRSPKGIHKRYFIFVVIFSTVFVYYFFFSKSSVPLTAINKCVTDEFSRKSYNILDSLYINENVSYIGNGFISLEAALHKQLLINLKTDGWAMPIFTWFWPLIEVDVLILSSISKSQHFLSDFQEGITKNVQCFMVSEKCVCTYQMIYAHRIRPNLLVQEIRISNPTTSNLEVNFNRPPSAKGWEKHENEVFLKVFDQGTKYIIGIKCSSQPLSHSVVIKAQTEETYRFLCIIEQENLIKAQENEAKQKLVTKVSSKFATANSISSYLLDMEHKKAWKNLNKASFNISYSKAPNALNSFKINLTRYVLLSSVRSPIIELESVKRQYYENFLSKTEFCYSGHSTLLTPSKLWQNYINIYELLKMVEIWLKTLEQHGCVHVLQAGAHGVSQAFLLSLIAATFTHHRLEIGLDPEEDLHRHINVKNLRFGANGLLLTLDFNIDAQLKPYVTLSSSIESKGTSSLSLYACSAGCLDAPKRIGNVPMKLAIKVTKPITPILFLAEADVQLQQLKETLHLIEVMDAPAHESEKIALHQHGENKGLPTVFWVILISLIVAFHLFFVKLIYTEWKNSSFIPYSKFSKKLLLKR